MALTPGTRVGPYEILAAIGAGGMGQVYRARDTRLDRFVAIKILSLDGIAPEKNRERLKREARAIARLSHPHICALFDIGSEGETDYLVMELLEGETLAHRLVRGPLPLPLALEYARQIADAVDAAHRQGIVHRDLKPGNVMLTKAGAKVLDFGLAKHTSGITCSSQDSKSPTRQKELTEEHALVGTLQYMAPEQLEGKDVDARTDIFALGSVLYEMATGRRAFDGKSKASLIAAILEKEPEPTTPRALDRLLKRCLAKDPDERWQTANDLSAELEWLAEEGTLASSTTAPKPFAGFLPWFLVIAATLAAALAIWLRGVPESATLDVTELDVSFPPDIEQRSNLENGFALSPDGRMVAMVGLRNGLRHVFMRSLKSPAVLEFDEPSVNGVVFSPDSTKIALLGAQVTSFSLADRQRAVLASHADIGGPLVWGTDGIIFARSGALWIAPSDGGAPRPLTALDESRHETQHTGPLFLPGGRTVLFSSLTTEPGTERIEAVSVDGGARRVIVERATTPVWSPTGHLLFGRDGVVLAMAFDPVAVQKRSGAVPVLTRPLMGTAISGALALRLARNGTLLFAPRDFGAERLVSVSRDGSALRLELPRASYSAPRVSPDGRRVVITTQESYLEVLDLERGTRAQLTTASPGTNYGGWNRDGNRIVTHRFGSLFWISSDGSDRQALVRGAVTSDFPSAPGPDSDSIIVVRTQPETAGDVFLLSLSGAYAPRPLVSTRAFEGGAQLSPDSRWLAYASNESGQFEIHVRRFPELDRHWQVSEGGGKQARWSATGHEIYYRGGPTIMAVPFDGRGSEPTMGKPLPLFPDDYDLGSSISIANYDVTPDGRFLMLRRDAQAGHLRIVLNWTEELKRMMAKAAAP